MLFVLGGLSQADVASVIGCAPGKVKALVFQARETMVAERQARDIPCEEIQAQLDVARGGVLRRAPLRRHLRQCERCARYRDLGGIANRPTSEWRGGHNRREPTHHKSTRPRSRPRARADRPRSGGGDTAPRSAPTSVCLATRTK